VTAQRNDKEILGKNLGLGRYYQPHLLKIPSAKAWLTPMCLLMGCMCLRVPFFYPDSASLPLWDTLFWHLSCQQRDSASRTSKHKANIYL